MPTLVPTVMGDQANRPAPQAGLPQKILIVMPNWLGDVIMTTPLLDLMHRAVSQIDESRRPAIHLAIRKPWSSLFVDDPRFEKLWLVDRGGRHGGLRGLWRQAQEFRREKFDAVLLGPPSLRAGLVAALARIPLRVGHATDGRGFLLNCALAKTPRGSRHYSFDMLDLGWAALANKNFAPEDLADFDLISEPQATGELPVPALRLSVSGSVQAVAGSRPYWVVAPGTTYGEAKTWPAQQVSQLLKLAVGQAGVRVVLLGDGQASEFVASLAEGSELDWTRDADGAGDIIDLTGQTDLKQVVNVLRSAKAFAGNDSGLMHLAGALGVPTVGVFGSSSPTWTHPLGERTAVVTALGFDCQPCYRKACSQEVFCLTTVSAADVFSELSHLSRGQLHSKESS